MNFFFFTTSNLNLLIDHVSLLKSQVKLIKKPMINNRSGLCLSFVWSITMPTFDVGYKGSSL